MDQNAVQRVSPWPLTHSTPATGSFWLNPPLPMDEDGNWVNPPARPAEFVDVDPL